MFWSARCSLLFFKLLIFKFLFIETLDPVPEPDLEPDPELDPHPDPYWPKMMDPDHIETNADQ